MVCLDGFQAGLSWLTIPRRREAFRQAFARFDVDLVAGFTTADVDRLVGDAGIVRHRGKIESVINNARRAQELLAETGSLAAYFWRFEPPPETRPAVIDRTALEALTTTRESTALSRDLRRRGWTFVGPTTAYAFMQATGIVNDHLAGCWCRDPVERMRRTLARPDRSA